MSEKNAFLPSEKNIANNEKGKTAKTAIHCCLIVVKVKSFTQRTFQILRGPPLIGAGPLKNRVVEKVNLRSAQDIT